MLERPCVIKDSLLLRSNTSRLQNKIVQIDSFHHKRRLSRFIRSKWSQYSVLLSSIDRNGPNFSCMQKQPPGPERYRLKSNCSTENGFVVDWSANPTRPMTVRGSNHPFSQGDEQKFKVRCWKQVNFSCEIMEVFSYSSLCFVDLMARLFRMAECIHHSRGKSRARGPKYQKRRAH